MKTQKIIKVGNSLAVTLPASFVKEGKLKVGDEILIEPMPLYKAAMIKQKDSPLNTNISPDFFDWINKFTKRHNSLLKELARTP